MLSAFVPLVLVACAREANMDADAAMRPTVAGIEVFDDLAAQRQLTAQYAEAHDLVAECMALEGFEYYEPAPSFSIVDYTEEAAGMSDARYAEEFGFGVAPVRLIDFSDSQLSEEEGIALADARIAEAREYEESLASSDLEAYEKTLQGGEDQPGCNRYYDEIVGDRLEQYFHLAADIEIAKYSYAFDQEVVEFYDQWAACFREEGYDFGSPLEVQLHFMESAQDATVQLDMAELEQLAAVEIAAARASVACGGSTRDFYAADLRHVWERYASSLG